MADFTGLEKFLNKVDDVESLVNGLVKGDENVTKEADKYIETHCNYKKVSTGVNRTVINSSTPHNRSEQSSSSSGDPGEANKDDFLKALEIDAEERYKKKKIRERKATQLKEEGNLEFRAGNFEKAIEFYSQGLTEVKDMTALWTNRAQAYNKIGQYENAISDCDWALRVFENCVKAYIHRGKAYLGLKQYDAAIESYNHIFKIDPKKEVLIKEYIAEVELARHTESDEQDAEAAFLAAGSEMTGVVQLLEKLNRSDQLLLYYSGGLRIITKCLNNNQEKTLFRTHGGMNLITEHHIISRCFKAHVKSLSQDERDVVWATIDTFTAACMGNDENLQQVTDLPEFVSMIQSLLQTNRKTLKEAVICFLLTISQTELGRTRIVAKFDIPSLTASVFSLLSVGGTVAVNGVAFLNNLALNSKYKKKIHTDVDKVFSAFEQFVMLCDITATTLPLLLSAVSNLMTDNFIRKKVTERIGCWDACIRLLAVPSNDLEKNKQSLLSLLGLLSNMSLEDSSNCQKSAPKLVTYCVQILKSCCVDLHPRSLRLLSHLLPKSSEAANVVYSTDLLEKCIEFLKTEYVSYSIKIITSFSQHVPHCTDEISDIKNALGNIVDLLNNKDETVVGNSSLCISLCAESGKVCQRLTKTNIIQHLLVIVRDSKKTDTQKNAGILIAKLAKGDTRHLERLRELHGIEILHNIMKHVD